jgi:glycine/D-amino acid oxidase-like deaminating enzyme
MLLQPHDDADSGWIRVLPPLPPPRPLATDERVDSAIIGGGLTGLAIARRLAELRPDERVAIVEAQRVGFGASGRNAGFVVELTDFAGRMAVGDRQRYVRVARYGIRCLEEQIAEHHIECGWDKRGVLRAAAGEAGHRTLERWPAWLAAAGSPWEVLDAEATAAVTGTRFYTGAFRFPGTANVQPAALVRGLARALPGSVEIYESSPVTAIRRERLERDNGAPAAAGFRVVAGEGSLAARRLFVAANGYTPGLGLLRARVSPLWSFASLTRVLTAAEQAAIGGDAQWGVLATDPSGSTVRRTPDQRIFMRNTFHFTTELGVPAAVREATAVNHRAAVAARWPALADVPFEHTWGGVMGMSSNGQAYFGEVEPKLFSTAIYNTAGLAMSAAAGRLLADLALAVPSPLLQDLRQLPPPSRLPPEPLRSLRGRRKVATLNSQAGAYL